MTQAQERTEAQDLDGQAIKQLREVKGWSQQDLANAAGLHAMTVSKAERGLPVHLDTAFAIAQALDVALDDLLVGADAAGTTHRRVTA